MPYLIILCIFIGSIISGTLGMAGGMLLMGVLAWLLPVTTAIFLHALAQFFSNGFRAFLHRRHILWRPMGFYAAGLLTACVVMGLLQFIPSKPLVFILLGMMPFLQYVLPARMTLDFLRPRDGYLCGLLSTVLHLSGGVTGILLDLFFQKTTTLTRHQIIATKAATQTLAHIARLVYFGSAAVTIAGEDMFQPWFYGAIVLAALGGTVLSTYALNAMSDARFRDVTQKILIVLGLVYLGCGLMLLLG